MNYSDLQFKFKLYLETLNETFYLSRDIVECLNKVLTKTDTSKNMSIEKRNILENNLFYFDYCSSIIKELLDESKDKSFIDFNTRKENNSCEFLIFPLIEDVDVEVDVNQSIFKDFWNKRY